MYNLIGIYRDGSEEIIASQCETKLTAAWIAALWKRAHFWHPNAPIKYRTERAS